MFKRGILGLALAGSVAFAGSALADGMATPSRAPVMASAYNWGGLYIGANAGYAWSDVDAQYFGLPGPSGHFTRNPSGFIGGGQVGVQHQFAGTSIVLGIEGALSGGGHLTDRGPDAPTYAGLYDSRARIGNILSIGPRLGYSFGNYMAYVTGGYAQASINSDFVQLSNNAIGSMSGARHGGWYLGGGVEYALNKNLILGVEYQHFEFDTACHDVSCHTVPTQGIARNVDATADVVRARLSFKIGRDAEPAAPLK